MNEKLIPVKSESMLKVGTLVLETNCLCGSSHRFMITEVIKNAGDVLMKHPISGKWLGLLRNAQAYRALPSPDNIQEFVLAPQIKNGNVFIIETGLNLSRKNLLRNRL